MQKPGAAGAKVLKKWGSRVWETHNKRQGNWSMVKMGGGMEQLEGRQKQIMPQNRIRSMDVERHHWRWHRWADIYPGSVGLLGGQWFVRKQERRWEPVAFIQARDSGGLDHVNAVEIVRSAQFQDIFWRKRQLIDFEKRTSILIFLSTKEI